MERFNNVAGITVSYLFSTIAFFQEIEIPIRGSAFEVSGFISLMTAFVGSGLTCSIIYMNYKKAKLTEAETRIKLAEAEKIENDDTRPI